MLLPTAKPNHMIYDTRAHHQTETLQALINVDLNLVQRLRCRANISSTVAERHVFAGTYLAFIMKIYKYFTIE